MSTETPRGEEQQSEQGEGLDEAGEGRSGENTAPGGITDPPPADAPADNASAASAEVESEIADAPQDSEVVDEPEPGERPTSDVIQGLLDAFEDVTWHLSHGQDVVVVPAEQFAAFGEAARDAGFEVCVDVTAVDWMRQRTLRFDIVANLLSHQHRLRLRMITSVGREEPSVPSLTPIWPGAGFSEREVYDMFGIDFDGHPDLTRILMPDDWEGHPLRKDFGVGSVPVQFKDSHKVR
jgi:NADH-quinone oxidoreductase subunit C